MPSQHTATRRFNWHAGTIAEFESDWMALHRFLWLNGLKGSTFWSQLRKATGKYRTATNAAQPFAETMRGWEHCAEIGEALRVRSLAAVVGEPAAQCFGKVDALRFCPECLARGFHSHLFRLEAVALCPYHGCPVVDGCTTCGQRIGRPRLVPDDFDDPFCCASCKCNFIDDSHMASALLGDFSEGVETFALAQAKLRMMRSITAVTLAGHCAEPFALSDHRQHVSHCLLANVGAQRFMTNRHDCSPIQVTAHTPSSVIFAIERYIDPSFDPEARTADTLSAEVRCAVGIAKSVHRQLRKRVRGICGHRHAPSLVIHHDRWNFSAMEIVALMYGDECPSCTVLAWWRAEVSKLLALHEALGDSESRSGGTAVEAEVDLRHSMLLGNPTTLAVTLLSTFARMAWAMWDVVHVPLEDTVNRFGRIGDSCIGWKWVTDHAPSALAIRQKRGRYLPISRYFLRPSIVRIERGSDQTCYAHTLISGEQVLAECNALAARGRLWAVDEEARFFRDPRPDIWYRGLVGHYAFKRDLDNYRIRYPEDSDPQLDLFAPEAPLRDRVAARVDANRERRANDRLARTGLTYYADQAPRREALRDFAV